MQWRVRWRSLFRERLREEAAVLIAVLALFLTIASVGDGNATQAVATNNVNATNAYAFFQAKNSRQADYELALDALDRQLALGGDTMPAAVRALLDEQRADYAATISRYESEPDPLDPDNPLKGEGKTQLLARARHYEQRRDDARDRGESFDYAATAAQLGIVLTSVAILIGSRRFIVAGAVAGAISMIFIVNALAGIFTVSFILN